jgi:3alpha(or 20beta)-hydroxysteroid dehydrogenase
MGRLAGKVALITGAARGQGEAEVRLFVEEGAQVVMGDVLDQEGEAVAKSLGDSVVYVHHDVSQESDWQRFVTTAQKRFGRIDVLVNNAGILRSAPIEEMSLEAYMQVIAINQAGVFLGIKSVIPAMKEAGGGSIVNISSTGGLAGIPGLAAYCSSKFALRGLTKVAAAELGPHNIRVNSVHPGGVDTPMVSASRSQRPELAPQYASLPLGRIGQPEEIAKLVLFLASDEASFSTGSEFIADGGNSAVH